MTDIRSVVTCCGNCIHSRDSIGTQVLCVHDHTGLRDELDWCREYSEDWRVRRVDREGVHGASRFGLGADTG